MEARHIRRRTERGLHSQDEPDHETARSLFSSDLTLDAEKMIEYYSLRFQIEFNFRDGGLQDFMNVNKIPVNNAVNLSMFMVSVSARYIPVSKYRV